MSEQELRPKISRTEKHCNAVISCLVLPYGLSSSLGSYICSN